MRILVTGKNGQLGQSINKIVNTSENSINTNQNASKKYQPCEFIFVGRDELDLSKKEGVVNYFDNNDKFDIIINCAAYTAVDKAEEEQGLANQVNHLAVKQLAEIANKQQAKLIHISTDYVFDGEGENPYTETDATNPINIYGKTKLAGEQTLKEIMPTDAIIIRTSWVYSEYGNNFVKTMQRLGKQRDELSVVSDQMGSPTYATDLANAILDTVQNKAFKEAGQGTQVYHYSNVGEISWYEFAKKIFKLAEIECKVNPINTEQYPTPARRPINTVLDKEKIVKIFDIDKSNWEFSLEKLLAKLYK